MSIFTIKMIACLTMILDHIKYALPITENFITIYLGRIAFPLFAFLITEGYIHTSNLKKYYIRLIVFGLISQIPFMLFRTLVGEWKMLNIMFTLLLGLLAITVYDKESNKLISIPIVGTLICLGSVVKVDYGWFGVATVFLIYILKDKKILLSILYMCLIMLYYYLNNMLELNNIYCILYLFFSWLPTIIMILYNGRQGRKVKYFFYWFYPIHMLILYGLSFIFI